VTPPPTTARPAPWTSSTRDITPSGGGQHHFGVDGLSRDGAYVDVDLLAGSGRLDVATSHLDVLPLRGEFTADGSAIIGLTLEPTPELRRHVIGDSTGAHDLTYPTLPAGWQIEAGSHVAIDDTGRHIGIVAIHLGLQRTGLFNLDTATGLWTQPSPDIPAASTVDRAWAQEFSTDGSSTVVQVHHGADGTSGQDEIWHIAANGERQLINVSDTGGPPLLGRSYLLDMSPDGRYVLFGSTSGNLAGVGGFLYGAVFVRDVTARTTSEVRYDVDPTLGAMSDDGQVVATAGKSDGGYPKLSNRIGDVWVEHPLQDPRYEEDAVSGNLALNSQGTRLAYTSFFGRIHIVDFTGTGR
jgi:hypothetical protein